MKRNQPRYGKKPDMREFDQADISLGQFDTPDEQAEPAESDRTPSERTLGKART
jgi:hypothetical protein